MAIFDSNDKKDVFLKQIRCSQIENNFQIYAYTIMDNHYHLLYKDVYLNMPSIIGTIQENYAKYYNQEFKHLGSVFTGPFKSLYILDRNHFYNTLCYILNNPTKAGLSKHYKEYRWNSPLEGIDRYNIVDNLYPEYDFKDSSTNLDSLIVQRLTDKRVFADELIRMEDDEARVLWEGICLDIGGSNQFNKSKFTQNIQEAIVREARYLKISIRQINKFSGLSHRYINTIKPDKEYI